MITASESMRTSGTITKLLSPLFIVGFAAAPIYVNASGQPQPGDFILIVWVILMAVIGGMIFPRLFTTIWGLLAFYIAVVSLVWAIILSDTSVLTNALFYIFNFIIGIALFSLIHANPRRAKQVLRGALYLSIAISVLMVVLNFNPGAARQVGGFNNPNQLGFYSLLQFCMLTMLYSSREKLPSFAWLAAATTILLTLLSSSLVAGVAIVVATIGLTTKFRLVARPSSIAMVLVVGLIGWLLMRSELLPQLANQWEMRVNVAASKLEDSVEQRGFDRLIDYPEYLILGAAEGALYRFGSGAGEIHSGPLAILFSYGIPGLLLLLTLFVLLVRRASMAEAIILLAPLVYVTTHQGFRTTMFWMFVVVAYSFMDGRPRIGLPATPSRNVKQGGD